MRLSQIKLAGFKSFVDPTTIHMPSNLIGVVGPNGCGKSNVIDAVRWVMGESSAKHLRGESLDDVIFNGSSVRKPVGMASVELLFDNSDGAISGAFASFTEISVKRNLSRDGTSVYYLNGSRCRRKDITGLFLGTGLGPRSYSIIEQGMVSRLIEAKPEEMRTYLEEAAGISKYKDRRRETENRIRHTRENLDRLNDLRDEVDKQLKHLQRQSRVAEKYKVYKQDQRRIGAEVLVLRLVELDEKLGAQQRELDARTTAVEAAVAEQRSVETKTETARETQGECHESLNKVQEAYYKHGAEIARLEQAIQHAREMRHRQERELAQIEESARDIETHIDRDRAQLADLLQMLQNLEPELEQARNSQQQSVAGLSAAEEARRDWQLRWEAHLRESNAARQESEVERTRIEHLSGQMTALERRKERLDEERGALSTETVQEQLNQLDQDAGRQRETLRGLQSELGDYVARIGQSRERDHDVRRQLDEAFDRLRDARGKIASLEALQKAALGQGSDELSGWLARAGLGDNARLGQRLSVQPGWERAVETVLGDSLEAVCVDGFDSATALLGDLEGASVTLFDQSAASAHGAGDATALADKLLSGTTAGSLLSGVFAADNIQQAMQLRGRLQAGESVVTRDGLWLGADWLRVSRDEDVHAGVIAREQELRGLRKREAELAENVKDLEQQHNDARAALQELEEARESRQAEVSRYQDTYAEIRAQRDAQVARLEHVRGQIESLESDSAEIINDIEQIRATLGESEGRLATAGEAMQQITAARQQLEEERANIDRSEEQARNQAEADRASAQELAIKAESRRSARESLDSGIARLATQMAQLTARRTALSEQIGGSQTPLKDMEQRLASELEQRVTIEQSLTDARKALEDIDLQLRQLDTKRHETEAAVETAREKMDQAKMVAQEARIHRESCAEQLSKTGFTTEELKEGLAEDASVASWDEQLERLQKRIDRLGPINLAAIDEFKEQSERKEYLDAQFNDLTEALDTLERAIHRIDRETRTRFKETYDKVDAGLKRMFPRLFGGGHAYLQLSDDDLLHAGVNVMAQPPGKRNSTIHLLSGGEKALTAVALIFSIFELNPAPFCMLDEVDAPLDDANVERFCDIVREMSDRVQFVIITHNKLTIELANHLAGVTMQEPGVSRLVAVDVEEAVQLAAM